MERGINNGKFILHLIDLAPKAVVMAAETHMLSLKNPAKTTAEYLSALDRQGLTQTASALREFGLEQTMGARFGLEPLLAVPAGDLPTGASSGS